jgi:hypothetical protein
MTFGSRLCAAILGGLLAIPSFHAATAGRCEAGDLDGQWHYQASGFEDGTLLGSSGEGTLTCDVTLTAAGGNQGTNYNISGTCKHYGTTSATPTALVLAGSTLKETSKCKFQGVHSIGNAAVLVAFPVTILDARIEGGSPKQRITGIARVTLDTNRFWLLRFRFQR